VKKWGWKRWLLLTAVIVIALTLIASVTLYFLARWAFNRIDIVDPGQTGRRVQEAGVFANYYPAPGPGRHPAILLLGGSEGGIGEGTDFVARTLQDEGVSVLSPSYFGSPGQPRHLELVPLETFDRALEWLRVQPEVDPDQLVIAGASKGAEAALLVATRHPELRAVVAIVPSSFVWPGIRFPSLRTPSSWTLAGEPLPFLPYGPFRLRMLTGDIGTVYRGGLEERSDHPDAAIPIERIGAPVLLVCGESDKVWPSCTMSRQLEARARERGSPSVQVLSYPDAGHGAGFPPISEDHPLYRPRMERFLMGGTTEGNNAARADAWPKMLAFVQQALDPD
jgi:uncharacterized protein